MTKEELIALGIEEETAKTVMALHGKEITQLNAKVATVESERDTAKEQLKSNQSELDTLKKNAKENEDLTTQLADLQEKFDQNKQESEKQLAEQKKEYSIRLALKEANPLDEDIVMSQLDQDTIKLTDEGLTGLKEQLEGLKEKKSFLFEPEKDPNQEQEQLGRSKRVTFEGNATPPSNGSNDPFSRIIAKYQK